MLMQPQSKFSILGGKNAKDIPHHRDIERLWTRITIDDYKPVIEPLQQYLYGNDGKQPGDPEKAAIAMIQAIESPEPPLRLLLGTDATDLWEKKQAAMDSELKKWREISESTAFEGVEVGQVGRAISFSAK